MDILLIVDGQKFPGKDGFYLKSVAQTFYPDVSILSACPMDGKQSYQLPSRVSQHKTTITLSRCLEESWYNVCHS